jgi:cyclophilin family peptidyl-prolyl cis-trans isomerase
MKRLSILICAAVCGFAQAPPATVPAPPAAAPQLEDGLYAIFNTQMGVITARLFEKETPNTVKNFVALATGTKAWKDPKTGAMVRRPLYSNIGFHRVMLDVMIQTGSATPDGAHDCGFRIKDEIRPDLKFDRPGRLAMATDDDKPNSGACQFFITQVSAAPTWNGVHTIFGQVVDGQSVVKEISGVPAVVNTFLAKKPPKLIGVTIKRVGPEPVPPPPPPPAKRVAAPPAAPAK